MSKRFGRNQKRALRKEIELKDGQIDQGQRDYRIIASRYERAKSSLYDVGRILDQHFLGFDPEDIQTHHPSIRMQRMEEAGITPIGAGYIENMTPVYINELQYLTTKAREELNGMIHIRVHHPETGALGYAISRQTMEIMPSDLFIERISKELALQLRKEIQSL